MIALIDCESFFASCEQVFSPHIEGRPIVVLSNNDGCVVAMNRHAKALRIPMGIPWFQLKRFATIHGVVARSSNYELYGSMSGRVMELIGRHCAWQEIYSIDESFVGMNGTVPELIALGRKIRAEVLQCTGIPVRVGIAPSKTLAKFAVLGAKADLSLDGVCHLGSYAPDRLDRIMEGTEVTELWGVARRSAKRLAPLGITNVRQLRDADPQVLRKKFSVVMERIVLELRGFSCISLEETPRRYKDQLIFSRSFSQPVRTVAQMKQVLSLYAQRVSRRLREQGQVAALVSAWAATAWHRDDFQSAHVAVGLPLETDEPGPITRAAQQLLPRLNEGARYVRAGVVLTGLQPKHNRTVLPIFASEYEGRHVGEAIDAVNRKLGRDSVGVGWGGMRTPPEWNMRRGMLSPRATTHWDELCEARV